MKIWLQVLSYFGHKRRDQKTWPSQHR